MIRIGINGIGRIGKAIFRNNLKNNFFDVVAINDINPDINNIAYQINYDTLYGKLDDKYHVEGENLVSVHNTIKVFNNPHIDDVPWEEVGVDFVIDASGVLDNVIRAKNAIKKNKLKKVIVTHSPKEVDFTMVLGANEEKFDADKHQVISSSICDATALGPVVRIIKDNFGINSGWVTTLHPWLNYQNLMDGSASSWSVPGEIYHHYALGRSSIGNIIPKPTSAMNATCKVVDEITEDKIGVFSYRTPHAIVGSADLTLNLSKETTKRDVIRAFEKVEKQQLWPIIHNNLEPLVSLDFMGTSYSAVVDHRWTDLVQGKALKLVLWYDNEWGYSSRVIDQIKFIESKL
ncbi:MAG: aldehyde dehydrogenase [Balneola sp.]|nr:MAG: aldehyde dehydrogenase [Balneola sp.]